MNVFRKVMFALAGAVVAAGAAAMPAGAASGDPVNIVLGSAFTGSTGKLATEQPAALRKCGEIPGGAKLDTDGWRFDQPVDGASALAYVIAFIKVVDDTPTPVLLGINADGVVEVPFTASAMSAPLAGEEPELKPAPAGVSGGLIDAGRGGAWLQTPSGWRLAYGVLQVPAAGSVPAAFELTAVCLPAVVAASTSASASVPSSGGASPSAAPTLPVTGDRVAAITAIGAGLVAAGVLLLWLRRRRDDVTFVP